MAPISHKIKAVDLIPGSGEFVISTTPMRNGYGLSLNTVKATSKTYIQATIDNLKNDFPNVQKVGLVLGWFGDSLNADQIRIVPKVEDREVKYGGDDWSVGNLVRNTAPLMSKVNGVVNWGGTYSDRSVIEACELLHKNGYEVMLYPMLYLDLPNKPWRGEIKANTDTGVKNFFAEYSKFILHYVNLKVGDKKLTDFVKVISIGSELKGLTAYVSPNSGKHIVIDEMIILASQVKGIVGNSISITYAADWSEYHHSSDGSKAIDKLWASQSIDFVGIDGYFTLTDEIEKDGTDYASIQKGWEKGLDYDYYRDGSNNKIPLSPDWAIKNIKHFFHSYHYDKDGQTAWVPKMKNITFTEFGCASVSGCSSKPYFYQYGKEAKIDNEAQARVIEATLDYWSDQSEKPENKGLVSDIYIYALDVRTDYNSRPELFADAGDDAYGHNIKVASIETIGNDCGTA